MSEVEVEGSGSVADSSPAKVEATDERTGELEAPVLPVSQLSPAAAPRPVDHGDEAVGVCLFYGRECIVER